MEFDLAKDIYETLVESGMTPKEAKAEVEALRDASRDGFPMDLRRVDSTGAKR
jgi:hypothetical protein